MILFMGSAQHNRSSSPFLFGSFSFVIDCGYVDNCALLQLAFATSSCGMIGREAEMSATVGPEKPVPKMPPASLPTWLPSKTGDYLGPKLEFRKSGPAATSATRRG